MIKYRKTYLTMVGILCGVLSTVVLFKGNITLSDIIYAIGFGGVYISMASVMDFLFALFPLLFFQIIMGNFIYEHYCIASVYFFCRCTNKSKWYIRECVVLYMYALAYVCSIFIGGIFFCFLGGKVTFDTNGYLLLVFYILIYSLWLFATTLVINMLSLLIENSKSFSFVCAVQLGNVALYGILHSWLDFSQYEGEGMEQQILLLKALPMSNLILKWHSSLFSNPEIHSVFGINYPFETSVFILILFSLIAGILGGIAVKYNDSIINGGEI